MRVTDPNSERIVTIRFHPYIANVALSILLLGSLYIPQVSATEAKRDIVMLVDNSGSMKKNDPDFLAMSALKTFISTNATDTRLALISFDKNVNLTLPFTRLTDNSRPILFDAINEIDYSGPLTNSPAALERAIYEFALHGRDDADKSIILITDGIVDTGNKTLDKQQEDWMQNELSLLASKLDIRIFGIAFAEAANYPLLQDLVSKTKGEHFRVLSADELPRVFARLEAVSRPVTKPLLQESAQAEIVSHTQPTMEAVTNTQELDETVNQLATIRNEPMEESLDAVDPLNPDEGLARPRPISIPDMLLNKARRLYAGNELIIYCAVLITLITLGALLLSRKSSPRRWASDAVHDPSFRDDQAEALLIDIDNNTSLRNHPLTRKVTRIGRARARTHNDDIHHMVIDKPTIGREHALIDYTDGSFWLIDNDSTNGTFIDGKRIHGRTRLKDGNRISFHDVQFVFSVPHINRFEKTVSVPAVRLQKETEFDQNALLAGELESGHSLRTSAMASTNVNRACADIGAYRRSRENTGFRSPKQDHQYSKPLSKNDPRNPSESKGYEGTALRSISDSEDIRHVPKTMPDLEKRSQSRQDNEPPEPTNISPDTNMEKLTQKSRSSDTEEIQVMPCLEIKNKTADREESVRDDTVELDIV